MDTLTFGQRLKDARKKAKLSQETVAKKVGMAQSLISELENNLYPTSGFTIKLAHLYKVNARWLADGEGPRDISASEAMGDAEVLDLWNKYNQASDASKAIVQYLLQEQKTKRPEWMSGAVAAMIESAKQLVDEQITKKKSGKDSPSGDIPSAGTW